LVILPIVIMAAVAGAGAQMPLKCNANTRVTEAIAGLIGDRSALADHLSVLAGDPVVAACQLIASLHVVADTHVAGYDQGRHRNTMRVIWALRALRYLTGCQDFRAPTRENPATWSALRRDWLLHDNSGAPVRNGQPVDGVPFFQTWMSRDSVFIAPRDTQEKIIARWHRWYRESGSRGVGFHTCESMDQWYF
jgi:hypothetical protein